MEQGPDLPGGHRDSDSSTCEGPELCVACLRVDLCLSGACPVRWAWPVSGLICACPVLSGAMGVAGHPCFTGSSQGFRG